MIGTLKPSDGDRWEIREDRGERVRVLHSGDIIELWVNGRWVQSGIEHDGVGYYTTRPGLCLVSGLSARIH